MDCTKGEPSDNSPFRRRRSLKDFFRNSSTSRALGLIWRRVSDRRSLELEAKKTCEWLRAAGFPQYAQLYEDLRFPIDISSVKKDHSFLDQDSLKALCRRLMTLNTCASMKLEVHFQRKQSEDSDEDDQCAISDRWAFQRESKRWSRLGSLDFPSSGQVVLESAMKISSSRESMLTDLSADLEATSLHSSNSNGSVRAPVIIKVSAPEYKPEISDHDSSSLTKSDQNSGDSSLLGVSKNQSNLKEKTKKRSRSFLKRLESLRKKEKDKDGTKTKDLPNTEVLVHEEQTVSGNVPCVSNESHIDGLKPDISKVDIPSQIRSHKFIDRGYRTKSLPASASRKPKTKTKCSGVYLEDYEMSMKTTRWLTVHHRHSQKDSAIVYVPRDHKPGTFPKSLSIESLCPMDNSHLGNWRLETRHFANSVYYTIDPQGFVRRKSPSSYSSTGSRTSIYDNVPEFFGSTGNFFDLDSDDIFLHLDDVLHHVRGLQEKVELWSKAVCPELDDESDLVGDSSFPSSFPSNVNFEEHSMSDMGTSASDFDSTGNSLNEAEEMEMRERRDSGVGASLTRPNRKLRWHSFQNSHRPSLNSASLEINRQSAAQLNLLQKLSLLRLTATMEKYSGHSKHGWAWNVPKFMKRSKTPDYRDKNVFGVPPIINVQRTGQPLPQSIQQAMRFLRSQCMGQVGIFRKSGVKSRIQVLRQLNEASPDGVNYEGQNAYDVADLLKQYFRDLPEPIFTSKLTDTFLQIYLYVPKGQHLQAVQAAFLLLPDENREVLQTLLYFLSDIASGEQNQMTAGNLAVCLAPSIFHLNVPKKESASPRVSRRRGSIMKASQKDLNENLAATEGLSHMITECKKLFQIPHDIMLQTRNSYIAADTHPLPLDEFGRNTENEGQDFRVYLDDCIQNLMKEAADKWKGWQNVPGPAHTELFYKKVSDSQPVRQWRVCTEIETQPSLVLHRLLRERHMWDEDLLWGKVLEAVDKNIEIYHYVVDSMAPLPRRDFVVLRKWRTDLPKGSCALVSTSVDYEKVQLEGEVRAVLLKSQYLIEPLSVGRSRLTYICRADLRGRSPDWYNKVFGHLCAVEVARLRDSFRVPQQHGLETKL
ncbi:stAR-related lipid transfer protein 8 isoform X2 [Protopterus annectens]|uniref:stAR-related lipid transfer protein 8 isoform X2 n=1 Tax=Protopterus annectens TaxID=7888 RepID=UPI001CFB4E30|nr:stAR-related lipid transfer protein 8 isoform X2 [Protopterus annectens]